MFRRFRRRVLRWLTGALILAALAAWLVINYSPDDPARWHLDPATIVLRGTPNEYLAAPRGTTAVPPGLVAVIHPLEPTALLGCFDRIARAGPRVQVLGGSVRELMITYVQRSATIGFPDYITVKAVPAEGGAGLIVYSRSRYGHGDFGVNAKRVNDWMKEAGAVC